MMAGREREELDRRLDQVRRYAAIRRRRVRNGSVIDGNQRSACRLPGFAAQFDEPLTREDLKPADPRAIRGIRPLPIFTSPPKVDPCVASLGWPSGRSRCDCCKTSGSSDRSRSAARR